MTGESFGSIKVSRTSASFRTSAQNLPLTRTPLHPGQFVGVWRLQPLPDCAPPGMDAMRLTYAVELSPRPYLPVALIERKIASDLKKNLLAIRQYVSD